MSDKIYKKLARQLDKLGNAFPATGSGIEIELLKKLFSPEEAFVAGFFTFIPQDTASISKRTGLSEKKFNSVINKLLSHGLLWKIPHVPDLRCSLSPFIVGSLEIRPEIRSRELSVLFEKYLSDGGIKGILGPYPPMQRVIPAHGSVSKKMLFDYDNFDALLERNSFFNLMDCYCREHMTFLSSPEKKCKYPKDVCIQMGHEDSVLIKNPVDRKKIFSVLSRSAEMGLVHQVPNTINDIFYICNCCGCCCTIMRGITHWGMENVIAPSNYSPNISYAKCNNCGACAARCQVKAVSNMNKRVTIDKNKCLGCGICAIGCPQKAITMIRKEEKDIVTPPLDFKTWQYERLLNRGLLKKHVLGRFSLNDIDNKDDLYISEHIDNGIFRLRSRNKNIKTAFYFFFYKENAIFTNRFNYGSEKVRKNELLSAIKKRNMFLEKAGVSHSRSTKTITW